MPRLRPLDEKRCHFTYEDGRRCTMTRMEGHDTFCCHHWNREEELDTAAKQAGKIVTTSQNLGTASGINEALGNVFRLLAQRRLPDRHAIALAYVGQLLLQSLPEIRKEAGDWAELDRLRMEPLRWAVEEIHHRNQAGQASEREKKALCQFQVTGLARAYHQPEMQGSAELDEALTNACREVIAAAFEGREEAAKKKKYVAS